MKRLSKVVDTEDFQLITLYIDLFIEMHYIFDTIEVTFMHLRMTKHDYDKN